MNVNNVTQQNLYILLVNYKLVNLYNFFYDITIFIYNFKLIKSITN